jgi:hypothetical protein
MQTQDICIYLPETSVLNLHPELQLWRCFYNVLFDFYFPYPLASLLLRSLACSYCFYKMDPSMYRDGNVVIVAFIPLYTDIIYDHVPSKHYTKWLLYFLFSNDLMHNSWDYLDKYINAYYPLSSPSLPTYPESSLIYIVFL